MDIEPNDNNNIPLEEDMDEISENMSNKSIEKDDPDSDSDDEVSSIFIKLLKDLRNCPYVKSDNSSEIPRIEFLNERTMKYNNKIIDINSYLKEISKNKFDYNYNKCEICHKKNNEYFCKNCSKNICEKCKITHHLECNCKNKDLIRLKNKKKKHVSIKKI